MEPVLEGWSQTQTEVNMPVNDDKDSNESASSPVALLECTPLVPTPTQFDIPGLDDIDEAPPAEQVCVYRIG